MKGCPIFGSWDPLYLQFYGLNLLIKGSYYLTVGKQRPFRVCSHIWSALHEALNANVCYRVEIMYHF